MKKLTFKIKLWIVKILNNINHWIDWKAVERVQYRYRQHEDINNAMDRWAIDHAKIISTEPKYSSEMDSWAVTRAKGISYSDAWKYDMDEWAIKRVFMIFETDPKERESIVALFDKYFGNIRTVKSQAAIELSKRMFTEELGRRSWGRVIEVKKGKTRHALAFVTTPDGEFKFNLGRHWEKDFPEIGSEGVVLIGEVVN